MPQSRRDIALHELASTLGRARVYLNDQQYACAKRELNGASEALDWLRKALTEEDCNAAS